MSNDRKEAVSRRRFIAGVSSVPLLSALSATGHAITGDPAAATETAASHAGPGLSRYAYPLWLTGGGYTTADFPLQGSTAIYGLVQPGPTAPFGMVQLSPDQLPNCRGYDPSGSWQARGGGKNARQHQEHEAGEDRRGAAPQHGAERHATLCRKPLYRCTRLPHSAGEQ